MDRSDELDEPRGAARRAVSLPLCGRRRRSVDRGIPPVSLPVCLGINVKKPPAPKTVRSKVPRCQAGDYLRMTESYLRMGDFIMMEARSFLRQAHRNANASHVEVRTTIRWGAKRFV